jgi:lipoprotein-anchoring transpeptidase ErfK/SrfK
MQSALILLAIANAAVPPATSSHVSDDTDVVEMAKATTVFARPSADATKLGVIKKKTRALVVGTADRDSDTTCPRWLEIAPRGWVCASSTSPTLEAPTATHVGSLASATTPLSSLEDDGELSPIRATYGMVRRGSIAYSSREDITNGNGHPLEGANSVRARGSTTIDGTRYWITTNGELIDSSRIYTFAPSKFKGVAITTEHADVPAQMPAWIRGKRDPYKPVATYAAPPLADARAKKSGEIAARTQVSILEASDDGRFVRIAEGSSTTSSSIWIAATDVRIASISEPPAGTRADEKWFDIDLDTQILVAYEGTRPVYATLVSTGKYGHYTPTLISRLASKHESTPMTSDKDDVYSVADVPWTMFYDGNYALHTSYWHDGFGAPRSHGCINLAPRDARVLFAWSSPDVPPGWSSVYGSAEQPGSLVRVRSSRLPAPKLRGYAKTMQNSGVIADR